MHGVYFRMAPTFSKFCLYCIPRTVRKAQRRLSLTLLLVVVTKNTQEPGLVRTRCALAAPLPHISGPQAVMKRQRSSSTTATHKLFPSAHSAAPGQRRSEETQKSGSCGPERETSVIASQPSYVVGTVPNSKSAHSASMLHF